MSDPQGDEIVRAYFVRLERALAPVPKGRRDQLVEELRDHVDAARSALAEQSQHSEAALREILERLGEPEVIAAEALGRDPVQPGAGGGAALSRVVTRRNGVALLVLVVVVTLAGTLVAVFSGSSTAARPETVAPTVTVGGFPTGLAVDSADHTVYVASGNTNALWMIDTATCNASTTSGCAHPTQVATDGQDPIGVVVDTDTGTVYAVNGGSDSVAVIDARTCNATDHRGCGAAPALVTVPGGPEFLALDSATDTVYVADTGSGTVSVIDGRNCNAESHRGCGAAPASVSVGAGAFPIAVDQSSNSVYVGTDEAVAVIDGSSCDATTTGGCSRRPVVVPVDNQPAGVAVDDADHSVYVSGESGTVAVIDAATCNGRVSTGCATRPSSVGVGSDPRGDAVDPATGTVYVTNAGSGTVSMLDTSACNASAASGCAATPKSFAVGASPRRVALDPTTGTLYVVNVLDNTVSVIQEASCNAHDRAGCPTAAPPASAAGVGVGEPVHDSTCAPTTDAQTSGGRAGALTSASREVAHGTVEGQGWSLWSARGRAGATGLEDGGLVLDGRAYGLCPGYPNPAELEMLDVGSKAIVAGVIGYPGKATVDLSVGTVGSFSVGAALPAPEVQVVSGVSFFIGALPKSACDYGALELNSTSPGVSAEHNLGFGSCVANELVPITASQGVWQLPAGQFPTGSPVSASAPAASAAAGDSACSPTTDPATSGGPASVLSNTDTEVAHGTVEGQGWSLWSAPGQAGATGLEDGGLVLSGRAYGLCPGFPNPAEFEMIDAGSDAIVTGVIGSPGRASVDLSVGTAGSFDVGAALPAPEVQVVSGVSFFIGALPKSACAYPSLEMSSTSPGLSAQHNLGFGGCVANEIVPMNSSMGEW